jgi:hypothetical protein
MKRNKEEQEIEALLERNEIVLSNPDKKTTRKVALCRRKHFQEGSPYQYSIVRTRYGRDPKGCCRQRRALSVLDFRANPSVYRRRPGAKIILSDCATLPISNHLGMRRLVHRLASEGLVTPLKHENKPRPAQCPHLAATIHVDCETQIGYSPIAAQKTPCDLSGIVDNTVSVCHSRHIGPCGGPPIQSGCQLSDTSGDPRRGYSHCRISRPRS